MSLNLLNLDARTRGFMLEEIANDISSGRLYISQRFNQQGKETYPELLKQAVADHDDSWLANELRMRGLFNSTEQRRKPKGGYTEVSVPVTAPDTLAEGEFNRFYARGLCARAINERIPEVEVYRAKAVEQPRSSSEAKIGSRIPAESLLNDLREHPGVDTALGLPNGPNSGLSVKLR